MDTDRQQQIITLFRTVIALPKDKQAGFLSTCQDGETRQRVEWLLGRGLEERGLSDALTGRRLGPWRIVKLLGEGGMGAVYLAERDDEHYRKTAAVKLLRRQAGDEMLVRRLAGERQTLAGLDHPNIVRLLDGGATEEGLPYLVMDYVEGVPLDEYCQSRAVPIEQRLRLFLAICSAVQYAHQNLIVHCDLKPPNILVTAGGTPKLLDFGIARLATGGPQPEERHPSRMFTPEYASPEQLTGGPINTATDVYALGLILWELLDGYARPAHDPDSGIHLGKRIQKAPIEAPCPDADLSAIAQMALSWEPEMRYGSVERLAEDLRRYGENLPVLAREQRLSYRARKFIRRNRAGVAAGAALAAAITGGLAATIWQAHVAETERARAERGFQDVRKLAHVLLFDFHDAVSKLPGSMRVEQLLVDRSLEYLDNVARDASNSNDRDLRMDLAEGYMKMGDLEGNPYEQNLGNAEAAAGAYRKALALLEPLGREAQVRRASARLHRRLGEVLPASGNLAQGVEQVRQAVSIMEPVYASDPRDGESATELATDYEILGDELGHPGLNSLGDTRAALASYGKALAAWQRAAALSATDMRAQRGVTTVLMKLGDVEDDLGQGTALERYRAALAVLEAQPDREKSTVPHLRLESMLHRKIAEVLAESGGASPAVTEEYRKALAITESLAAADPSNLRGQQALAVILHSLGDAAERSGDVAGAIRDYGRVADIEQRLLLADPSDAGLQGRLGETQCVIGRVLERAGQKEEALRQTGRGIAMLARIAERKGASAPEVERIAATLLRCHPSSLQDPAAALRYALKANEMTKGADAEVLDVLADAYERNGNHAASIQAFERARAILPLKSPLRERIEEKLAGYRTRK